ncbi:yippee-domain-containing protein [Corynespora cassiicola Philippines]|uniref:Yippee-domain-containing protein n=1 Tax=Corynespora cassiicola Philippines TaxID=1448308 RepID=A0A2T2N7C8_CORCC|nr:yippee-domain-containing protein [Corynespora cassiicola Philippines]
MPLSGSSASSFPLYLLPSIPFRRRRSSASASTSTASASPSSSPPAKPTSCLSSSPASQLRCHKCLSDLIPTTSIISKGFTGRHGRAYLVAPPSSPALSAFSLAELPVGDLPNTSTHKPVPRQLVTGAHTVSDISCRNCGSVLGWKYVEAEEDSQRYKVGKFILETKRVVKGSEWDQLHNGHAIEPPAARREGLDEQVEFDSQDEDECEDLFSGIWNPQLARRRRRNRAFEPQGHE